MKKLIIAASLALVSTTAAAVNVSADRFGWLWALFGL